jgi:hypothetical protein
MATDLNLVSILYIAYRLAPFILVSFFTLSSVFNNDFKGLIFLAGLMIATFVSIIIGNAAAVFVQNDADKSEVCDTFTLSSTGVLSNIPLGTMTISYTFFYLLYTIIYFQLEKMNIFTLLIFPILLLSDIVWSINNTCAKTASIMFAVIIGFGVSWFWAFILQHTNSTNLMYFSGVSGKEVCSMTAKQNFRCKTKSS